MTDFSYLRRQDISECRPDDIWRKIVSQTCERVIFQELVSCNSIGRLHWHVVVQGIQGRRRGEQKATAGNIYEILLPCKGITGSPDGKQFSHSSWN
jgi:hypothetical protein